MSALEALKQQPSDWGPLLTHIICTKLDAATLSEWETKSPKHEIAKVEDFIAFLDARSQVLEAIESSKNITKIANSIPEIRNDHRKNKIIKNNNGYMSLIAASEIKCYACDLGHTIYKCPTFLKLAVTERIKRFDELGLCKVCLRKHEFKQCLARSNCYKCHKRHNTFDGSREASVDVKFHEYLMFRVNNECHIFGHVSILDWLFFFCEYYPSTLGIRVIKYMFTKENGCLCTEERKLKEGYSFSQIKSNYIMPTQIKCCLEEALLEANLLSFRCVFKVLECNVNIVGSEEYEVDFLCFIREYF